jgi:large subunit ribosomal protein L17
MRHRKVGRKLKRTSSHRRATLAALSTALLRHKRITTTLAKAKETRGVVEKLITRARKAGTAADAPAVGVHHRRMVARLIKDRSVVSELFSAIAEKVGQRPGGYTRIVRLGQRKGDGAEMAVIELVDFNTGQEAPEKAAPAKRKRKAPAPKAKKASPASEPGEGAESSTAKTPSKRSRSKRTKDKKGEGENSASAS